MNYYPRPIPTFFGIKLCELICCLGQNYVNLYVEIMENVENWYSYYMLLKNNSSNDNNNNNNDKW